jgi:D-sedoheptulose 7-phosphate isomerase
MTQNKVKIVHDVFGQAIAAHQKFAGTGLDAVVAAAEAMSRAAANGRTIIAFGNGGSAGDAQHLAAELVGRLEAERRPVSSVALSADSLVVTALSNDLGYEHVFARQIDALGRPGDVALGISTSGRSKNVELALDAAKSRGLVTIALTGRDGGAMGARADIHVNVADSSTARIQEVHRTILHAVCLLVEHELIA